MKLWQVTARRMMGETVEPVVEPAKGDKRFKDEAWKESSSSTTSSSPTC